MQRAEYFMFPTLKRTRDVQWARKDHSISLELQKSNFYQQHRRLEAVIPPDLYFGKTKHWVFPPPVVAVWRLAEQDFCEIKAFFKWFWLCVNGHSIIDLIWLLTILFPLWTVCLCWSRNTLTFWVFSSSSAEFSLLTAEWRVTWHKREIRDNTLR